MAVDDTLPGIQIGIQEAGSLLPPLQKKRKGDSGFAHWMEVKEFAAPMHPLGTLAHGSPEHRFWPGLLIEREHGINKHTATPYRVFRMLLGEDLLKTLIRCTNERLARRRQTAATRAMTEADMLRFLASCFIMGIVDYHKIEHYWGHGPFRKSRRVLQRDPLAEILCNDYGCVCVLRRGRRHGADGAAGTEAVAGDSRLHRCRRT